MVYDVKLKSGFFKTQQYTLAISNKQITLTPQEDSGDCPNSRGN